METLRPRKRYYSEYSHLAFRHRSTLICVFGFYRALDKNKYNHITATYFLLAEIRLRRRREEEKKLKLTEAGLK